jgi:outer membrane protein assembly factor BamB
MAQSIPNEHTMMTTLIPCLMLTATLASAADWPQWRGPNRDGISTETGWSTQWRTNGPEQLWKFNVGLGCSSVVVSRGLLYTQGNQDDTDTIFCFKADTGVIVWKYSYSCALAPENWEGGTLATPTVDGDRVYTVSKEGHIFCFQSDTGKIIWSKHVQNDLGGKPPTWGYAGSPFVVNNRVLFDIGAPGGGMVALDNGTGDIVWKSGADPAGYSTPTLFTANGRQLLACFHSSALVVHELQNGKEVARTPWKTQIDLNALTPTVAGDKIFIASGYGRGGALFELAGSELKYIWQTKKMRSSFASCVLWNDHLYGFDDVRLTCLTFATGEVDWQQEGFGKGSLMLADGKLIIQGEKGDLVIAEASPTGFKELARAKVLTGKCWVVPVLANGRLYCKNNAGDLLCLEVSEK